MSAASGTKSLERWYEEEKKKVYGGGGGGEIPPVDPPTSAEDNEPMEARVLKLEEFAQDTRDRLTRIETRLEQTVTKGDLSESMHNMVKWIVGTAAGLGVASITVMTFVLNNAAPKAPVAATPAPIIINVPAPQTVTTPAPK